MIVITGATGFIGREVVKEALAEGHRVRAIVRDLREAKRFDTTENVELFHGNVLSAESLAGAFDRAKAVIHLVGIINEWKENTFQRAHVEATRNVVDGAKKAGVKRYIHMSALGAREGAASRYHQTKWAAEEYVRKSGLAWTIFRPSLVYGEGDRSINVLRQMVRTAPFIPVLGKGEAKIQPVSVRNVALAFVRAIKNDDAIQKIYDLVGPEAFTWNELYDKLMTAAGVKKRKTHMPVPLMKLPAAVWGRMLKYPPFNTEQLIMSQEDNAGDPLPAAQDFALTEESFDQAVRR
jgi:NADH dehydrogenase